MLIPFPENKGINSLEIFKEILRIILKLISWISTRNDRQKIPKRLSELNVVLPIFASISIAALIQQQQIHSAIVGLSPHNYSMQNRQLENLPILDAKNLQEITIWTCDLHGDVYEEERDKTGAHAKVMKYNLNAT